MLERTQRKELSDVRPAREGSAIRGGASQTPSTGLRHLSSNHCQRCSVCGSQHHSRSTYRLSATVTWPEPSSCPAGASTTRGLHTVRSATVTRGPSRRVVELVQQESAPLEVCIQTVRSANVTSPDPSSWSSSVWFCRGSLL